MMMYEETPVVTARETMTTEMDARMDAFIIWDMLEVLDIGGGSKLYQRAISMVDQRVLYEMLVFLLKEFPTRRRKIISRGRRVAKKMFNITVQRRISKFTPIMYLPEEQRIQREQERNNKELQKARAKERNLKRERKGFRCIIDNKSPCRVSPEIQQRVIDIINSYPSMSSKKHMTEYIKTYGANDVGRSMIDNIIKRMKDHNLIRQ